MALSPAFFAPPAALGRPVARRRPLRVALPALGGVAPSRETDEAIQSPLRAATAPVLIFGTVAAGYAVAVATALLTHLPALPLP